MTGPTEREQLSLCPHCERPNILKNGHDRRGAQVYRCADCRRSFTALTGTPFSGHSFPPAVIGLAVRWSLRFRLSYAEVVEWLAERSIPVDASTVFDGVQKFAPLYQDAAKVHRCRVGLRWSVDETYMKVAGRWGYVYRAIDEFGQVVEVLFREQRDTEAAAAFFRSALESTGVTPHTVTTDKAAAYPPALAEVLPEVEHLTGKAVQQRIERDHQHLKDFACFAGARPQVERSGSVEPMALYATSARAFTGSGWSHGIRTMPSGRGWSEPGKN
jgi:transposase, IS6 family